jgi:hypothetical protein
VLCDVVSRCMRLAVFWWFLAVIALLLLLGSAALVLPFFDWRLFLCIRRARREVEHIVAPIVPGARVFSRQAPGLTSPRRLAFWVTTRTDAERDRLLREISIAQLQGVLRQVGCPTKATSVVRFVIQSQETVDREYGGSWREAAEMP